MVNIEVDGKILKANENEYLIDVLKRENIDVPTLCHLKDFAPTGACRICVVEVEGEKNLIPSCSYPVKSNLTIRTNSKRVINARKTIIELLLDNHPNDCPYCEKSIHCELLKLSRKYDIKEKTFYNYKRSKFIDSSSASIVKDTEKCILCGRCVKICEEVQGVSCIDFIGRGSNSFIACAFDSGLNVSSCINCGQCVMVCPTGALTVKSHIDKVLTALENPDLVVVAQHAPSVSISLGEEFNMEAGVDVQGKLTGALKKIGFNRVFDTSFSADLTIMEEVSELIERIRSNGPLPMFTSCSPGWIKFIEAFHPELIPNLSTCKSPQQMLGSLIKNIRPGEINIKAKNIFSVSIMPCAAKKFESERPEMSSRETQDIDAVLTTREIAKIFKMKGIDLKYVPSVKDDLPFGFRSSSGKLFGTTGGVMEAAIRTAHYLLTGENLKQEELFEIRNLDGHKEIKIKIKNIELGFAVVSGIKNAQKLIKEVKNGRSDLHFIEVMTCPGGCIAGGGQPYGVDLEKIKARMNKLYEIDKREEIRYSHENNFVNELYKNFLEHPLSKKSHKLLHTKYISRKLIL